MLVMEALLRLVRASDAPIMPDVLLRVISDESSPASAKVDAYGRGSASSPCLMAGVSAPHI